MEYVDGLSLQAAVSQYGTFSVGEAASVGVQVADGLVQAAAVGLVHRDIKPANLLVDRRGAAKILDLGIVRFTHEETFSRFHGGAEVILGTLDYLAPEQAEDSSKVDARADIYGLGSTLYFLLAGHPPYTIADPREKLAAKQAVDPPSIHQLRPDVSAEFSAVVARLMARCPADRYPSPALAVAALYPWSAPGSDFPGRLFRMSSDSTDHGRRFTDNGAARDSIPDTVVIVKTGLRRPSTDSSPEMNAPTYPPDPPSEISPSIVGELSEHSAEDFPDFADISPTDVGLDLSQAADTQGVGSGGALTDEVVKPPELMQPLDLVVLVSERNAVSAPSAAEAVLPGNSPIAESPQNAGYRRGVAVGVLLAVVAMGVVAALIAIFAQ
jgi:serine/threonine protein kinase